MEAWIIGGVEQLRNFGDVRKLSWCAFCGGPWDTHDHVPSKVLLAEPLPSNLPVVPACRSCNVGLSRDEDYVAALLECTLAGSTDPHQVRAEKVATILRRSPRLVKRFEKARTEVGGRTGFLVELDRLERVVMKLARGHSLYELNEPLGHGEPRQLRMMPFAAMNPHERVEFETPPRAEFWPEAGSRAMQRMVIAGMRSDWIVVQPGRYRYLAHAGGELVVRMVLREYLAAEVVSGPPGLPAPETSAGHASSAAAGRSSESTRGRVGCMDWWRRSPK